MSRWLTPDDASNSRPMRVQWAICCAALRLLTAAVDLAASYRSSGRRIDGLLTAKLQQIATSYRCRTHELSVPYP